MNGITNDMANNLLKNTEEKELPVLFVYSHIEAGNDFSQEARGDLDKNQPLWKRILLKLIRIVDEKIADDSGNLNLDTSSESISPKVDNDKIRSKKELDIYRRIDSYLADTEYVSKSKLEAEIQQIVNNSDDYLSLHWVKLPETTNMSDAAEAVTAETEEVVQFEPLDLVGIIRKILTEDPTEIKRGIYFYKKIESLCKENNISIFEYQHLENIFDSKKLVGYHIYQGINKTISPNVVMDEIRKACPKISKEMMLQFQSLICQALDWKVDLDAVYYMGTNGGNVEIAGNQDEMNFSVLPSMEQVYNKGVDDKYLSELYNIRKNIDECERRRQNGTMGIVELRAKVEAIYVAADRIINGKDDDTPKYQKSLAEQYNSSVEKKKTTTAFLQVVRQYYQANAYWISKENWQQFDSVMCRYEFLDVLYKKAYPAFSMSLKAGWGDRFILEDKKHSDVNARNALCESLYAALEKSVSGKNCAQAVVGIFTDLMKWTDCREKYRFSKYNQI